MPRLVFTIQLSLICLCACAYLFARKIEILLRSKNSKIKNLVLAIRTHDLQFAKLVHTPSCCYDRILKHLCNLSIEGFSFVNLNFVDFKYEKKEGLTTND